MALGSRATLATKLVPRSSICLLPWRFRLQSRRGSFETRPYRGAPQGEVDLCVAERLNLILRACEPLLFCMRGGVEGIGGRSGATGAKGGRSDVSRGDRRASGLQ